MSEYYIHGPVNIPSFSVNENEWVLSPNLAELLTRQDMGWQAIGFGLVCTL